MDIFIDLLTKFALAIWNATDPFGVAFAIIGTYVCRWIDGYDEPEDKKDRTTIQRILPVIPVFLGVSWVLLYEIIAKGSAGSEPMMQRALSTGCSAIAVHKIWWHTIKNT